MTPLDDLIQKRLHGLASAEELKELDALLASSPEAADLFARATRLDFALRRHYRDERAVSTIHHALHGARRRRLFRVAAAALVLVGAGIFLGRGRERLATCGDRALHAGDQVEGPARITFPGEGTTLSLDGASALTLEA